MIRLEIGKYQKIVPRFTLVLQYIVLQYNQ